MSVFPFSYIFKASADKREQARRAEQAAFDARVAEKIKAHCSLDELKSVTSNYIGHSVNHAVADAKHWELLPRIVEVLPGNHVDLFVMGLIWRRGFHHKEDTEADRLRDLEDMYQAFGAAKWHSRVAQAALVRHAESMACFANMEGCFDWAKSKAQDFEPPTSLDILSLAASSDNDSLARKVFNEVLGTTKARAHAVILTGDWWGHKEHGEQAKTRMDRWHHLPPLPVAPKVSKFDL